MCSCPQGQGPGRGSPAPQRTLTREERTLCLLARWFQAAGASLSPGGTASAALVCRDVAWPEGAGGVYAHSSAIERGADKPEVGVQSPARRTRLSFLGDLGCSHHLAGSLAPVHVW